MPVEFRKSSHWWYGRFVADGRRHCVNLRVRVRGERPGPQNEYLGDAAYRRDVGNGYSFFFPVDQYNLSSVPTAHLRVSVAEFGMAWV